MHHRTWHGYTECPVCGSRRLSQAVVDGNMLEVGCDDCGQTIIAVWVGPSVARSFTAWHPKRAHA